MQHNIFPTLSSSIANFDLENTSLDLGSTEQGNRPRIVLAEDDRDLRSLMRAFLQDEGYEVLACADGQRALEVCRDKIQPDLLLSDIDMPRLNGIELATAISASRSSVPIILMSGSVLGDAVLSRLDEAGWKFFHKPFTLPEMLSAIHAALATAQSAEMPSANA